MADVLVSIALEKLTHVREKQQRLRTLSTSTANELERLKDTVQSIRPFLLDALSREIDSRSVHDWLSELGAVSYDIDDLLNKRPISTGLGEEGDERKGRYKVCKCLLPIFSCWDHAFLTHKIAGSIQEVQKSLDDIYCKINRYGFVSSGHGGDDRARSLIQESKQIEQMICREKDKETMISRLLSGSRSLEGGDGQADVMAIIGGAGVGKSTLAREIFHDRTVRDHFNMFVWVHVSSASDVIQLTKAILEKVKGTITFSSELNSLQNELVKQLRGKCFLLVFDNFQSDPAIDSDGAKENWISSRLHLNSSAQGSRILVTTSMENVAKAMNATFIHKLEGLSYDYSWELFRSRAFVGREEEYSRLEDVGTEIVKKCAGVPLAIKAIANVMHSKKTVEEWEKTLNSNAWQVENSPALSLTYCNLPSHLKLRFTYCSMFPRGWVFEKDTLVNLWTAQGFDWSGGSREIEDVGAEYIDDLVAWSVFQQVREDGETRYAMHDSFNLLATRFGQMHSFSKRPGGSRQFSANLNQRHLFLHSNFHNFEFELRHFPVDGAEKLRTLWLHGIDISNSVVLDLFHQAKFLRALILIGSKSSERMVKVPNAIVKMKHLRYLDLSDSNIVELSEELSQLRKLQTLNLTHCVKLNKLPEELTHLRNLRTLNLTHCVKLNKLPEELTHLCNLRTLNLTHCVKLKKLPEELTHLHNLRTLNLTHCVKLKRLPRGMGEMVSLRYLEIEGTDSLEYLPKGLGSINSLQSLCKFIVGGGGSEGGEECGIEELLQLNSLHGTLRIQHLERVSSSEEASKAQLGQKQYLRRLVISMSGRDDDAESKRMKGIVDSLTPHTNLKELKLFRYTGSYLPRWMLDMRHLWKVELVGCPRLEVLPIFDNDSPTEITVRDCRELKLWNPSMLLEKLSVIDSSEFLTSGLLSRLVSLKTLVIGKFRYRTFPDGGWNGLKLLQTLDIWGCDELKSLPQGLKHLQSLENLMICGCDNLEWLAEELGQLQKLKNLEVFSCKKLKALPDLPHLQRLSIDDCPLLLERYEREGADWRKISHIPNITINKQRIR